MTFVSCKSVPKCCISRTHPDLLRPYRVAGIYERAWRKGGAQNCVYTTYTQGPFQTRHEDARMSECHTPNTICSWLYLPGNFVNMIRCSRHGYRTAHITWPQTWMYPNWRKKQDKTAKCLPRKKDCTRTSYLIRQFATQPGVETSPLRGFHCVLKWKLFVCFEWLEWGRPRESTLGVLED